MDTPDTFVIHGLEPGTGIVLVGVALVNSYGTGDEAVLSARRRALKFDDDGRPPHDGAAIDDGNGDGDNGAGAGAGGDAGAGAGAGASAGAGAGSEDTRVLARTFGPPAAPVHLHATAASAHTITLEWGPPAADGGAPITDYLVSYTVEGQRHKSRVGNPQARTFVIGSVAGEPPSLPLPAGTEVLHTHVAAINKYGVGAPRGVEADDSGVVRRVCACLDCSAVPVPVAWACACVCVCAVPVTHRP